MTNIGKETDQYFLVFQRRALAAISARKFEADSFAVEYTKITPNSELSRKGDPQSAHVQDAYQYCVLDNKDRLVKPKKLTKKGKNLHIDVADDYSFEILNFFEKKVKKEINPKFVSHRNSDSGYFEAIDAESEDVVELDPDQALPTWCSWDGMVMTPESEEVGLSHYATEDLRSSLNPIVAEPSVHAVAASSAVPESAVAETVATQPAVAFEVAAAESVASDAAPSIIPYLLAGIGIAALWPKGGAAAAAVVPDLTVPDLTIQGRIMFGPVVPGNDLYVTAYDANGNVIGSTKVKTLDGSGGIDYQITVPKGSAYSGVVTVRLYSTAATADYTSEYLTSKSTNANVDLGRATLYAMESVSAGTATKVINITQATDLVARHFLTAATVDTTTPKLGAYTASQVNLANQAIAKILLGLEGQSIVELPPETTLQAATSDYALLLHSLDVYLQQYVATERTAVTSKQTALATAQTASDAALADAVAKAAAAKAAVGTPNEASAKAASDAAAAAAKTAADAATAAAQALADAQTALANKIYTAQKQVVSWPTDTTPVHNTLYLN